MATPGNDRSAPAGKAAAAFWLVLVALWSWAAGGALRAYFSTDDTNNLYTYWQMGWAGLVKANLLFFSGAYRPMGGVLYYTLYSLFGFEIVAFRLACLAVILANIVLLYLAIHEITADHYTAAAATTVASVHPALMLIWYSNGTLFDSLCYLFYTAALWTYLRGKSAATVLLLHLAALNSKEMAVTLPLVCAVHEVWARKRRLGVLVAMLSMAGAFAAGKLLSPLAGSNAYHPVFTVSRYLETSRSLLGSVFQAPYPDAAVLGLYALMAVHLAVTRSRELAMAATIAVAGFLPLNFITPREPFVVYLPLAGWAMYAMLALRQWKLRGWALVAIAFGVALFLNVKFLPRQGDPIGATMPMRRLVESMKAADPKAAAGSCVLVSEDPFFPDWDTYFLAKLFFRDPSVRVLVAHEGHPPRGDDCTREDVRVEVKDGAVIAWTSVK